MRLLKGKFNKTSAKLQEDAVRILDRLAGFPGGTTSPEHKKLVEYIVLAATLEMSENTRIAKKVPLLGEADDNYMSW